MCSFNSPCSDGIPLAGATSSNPEACTGLLTSAIDNRPTSFLRLPRELRDKVYTYLLSMDHIRKFDKICHQVNSFLNVKLQDRSSLTALRTRGEEASIDTTSMLPSFTRTGESAMKQLILSIGRISSCRFSATKSWLDIYSQVNGISFQQKRE